jgi:hypothetical protein
MLLYASRLPRCRPDTAAGSVCIRLLLAVKDSQLTPRICGESEAILNYSASHWIKTWIYVPTRSPETH